MDPAQDPHRRELLDERLLPGNRYAPSNGSRSRQDYDLGSGGGHTPLDETLGHPNERLLSQSWLLILFAAPLIIALLIWLLILLRRRLELTRHVLCWRAHQQVPAVSSHSKCGSRYLSSAEESCNQGERQQQQQQQQQETKATSDHRSCNGSILRSQLFSSMRQLTDHTNVYLVALAYQEIIGCLVAFTVAILNIVRVRNLFCCNLVLFVLIASKLLNLLTLASFSLSKLYRLLKLRQSSDAWRAGCKLDLLMNDQASGAASKRLITTGSGTSGSTSSGDVKSSCNRGARADMGQKTNGDKSTSDSREGSHIASSKGSTNIDNNNNNNTISRLLVKEAAPSSPAPGERAGEEHSSLASYCAGDSDLSMCSHELPASCELAKKMHTDGKQSTTCRLLLLICISSSLSLVCLYLRLMPLGAASLADQVHLQRAVQVSSGNKSADPWGIAIYSPTSTTEASIRYSSSAATILTESSEPKRQEQEEGQHPSYLASWSGRFQQSSQLRHLIDQYELQSFMQLLLDTQLQTSRFVCTLAITNYASMAKLGMLILYGLCMLAILCSSLAVQRVGRSRLAKLTGTSVGCYPSLASSPIVPLPEAYSSSAARSRLQDGGAGGRKARYSELMRQNLHYHHQSSPEMAAGSQQRHQQQQQQQQQRHQWRQQARQGLVSGRKLRNSSSMSSLLMSSAERSPASGKAPTCSSSHYLRQQQQRQLKRLALVQSMTNLTRVGSPPGAAKLPAGKLASSGGQLAWLPLGSAATVASLTNIGRDSASSRRLALAEQQPGSRRRAGSNTDPLRPPLVAIGEHRLIETADCVTLAERDESGQNEKLNNKLHNQRLQQQQQHQQQLATAQQVALYSNRQQHQLVCGELKRDLKLSQTLILFGQLLNHAPVLLLLTLANLLPDGLLAGWNSSHDNGFIWLTLIEAFAFPLILCGFDSRLGQALRRSLGCSRSPRSVVSSSSSPASLSSSLTPSSSSSHDQLRFGRPSFSNGGPGKRQYLLGLANNHHLTNFELASHNRPLNAKAACQELILGASSSHPDFMLACQPSRLASRAASSHLLAAKSLTGPPYPVHQVTGGDRYELAIDIEDTLRANFVLAAKSPLIQQQQVSKKRHHSNMDSCPVGTADLMASRRARYGELLAVGGQQLRKRRTNAILSATRRLFQLTGRGRERRRRQARRHASSGYLVSGTNTTDNNTASSRGGGRRAGTGDYPSRLSPTSSLSTLIRKFNHDNYTNVCQQYEQQKLQLEEEEEELQQQKQQSKQVGAQQQAKVAPADGPEEILIDGLDSSSSATTCSPSEPNPKAKGSSAAQLGDLLDVEGIFCRRGGLYYNYSLESDQRRAGQAARVNPLHSGRHFQASSAEGPLEKPAEFERAARVMELAAASGGKKEGERKNNEPATIISNISSVQELLDRMNCIMGSQLADKTTAKPNSRFILDMTAAQATTNDTNNNHKQSAANQLRQSGKFDCNPYDSLNCTDSLDPTAAYATLRSLEDAMSLVSVSSEFEYHNIRCAEPPAKTQPAPLAPELRQQRNRNQSGKLASSNESHDAKRADGRRPQENNRLAAEDKGKPGDNDPGAGRPPADCSAQATGGAAWPAASSSKVAASMQDLSSDSRRLRDLRFPSFLGSGEQQANQQPPLSRQSSGPPGRGASKLGAAGPKTAAAKANANVQPNPTGSAGSRHAAAQLGAQAQSKASSISNDNNKIASSSLLNLTVAKFAALNGQPAGGPKTKRQSVAAAAANNQLANSSSGSSGTITKQRASGVRVVALTEFSSRNQLHNSAGSSRHLDGNGQQGSLPAESGLVRAQIRKMEQQSTPNLSFSSQHQQLSMQSGRQQQTTPPSMIPVSQAASRLPVMAGRAQAGPNKLASSTSNSQTRVISGAARGLKQQRAGHKQ